MVSTAYALSSTDNSVPPIGKPISNVWAYVLSPEGALVPKGSVGELYIGGAGVTRGYLNRPELTAQCFVDNPFLDRALKNKGKMYKTGDLVRYLGDGNLEFVGRIDQQVKIRGYRIELGEIEQQLLQLPQVKSAVVVALESRLVAYFTCDKSS